MKECLERHGCVALTGAGGVGYVSNYLKLATSMLTMLCSKTQAAIEYCWRFRGANPDFHVFWINASSIARFDADYRRLAKKLGLACHTRTVDDADMREGVKYYLDDLDNWLMVIDNADRYDDFFATKENDVDDTVQAALPRPCSCTAMIIYTSRHDRVGAQLTDHNCLQLDILSASDGIAMFRSKIGNAANDEQVLRLLVAVDSLPLSIAHAAAYLRFTKVSIDLYLSKLEESDKGLLDMLGQNMEVGRRNPEAPRSVVKAWQVSFDLLNRLNRPAANLFCLMACLERNDIPRDIISSASNLQRTGLRNKCHATNFDLELPRSQGDLWTAIGEILSLALITHGLGTIDLSMHRYVQAMAIRRLLDEGRLLAFCELSALSIVFMFNSSEGEAARLSQQIYPTTCRVSSLILGFHINVHICDIHTNTHCMLALLYENALVDAFKFQADTFNRKADVLERNAETLKLETDTLKLEMDTLKGVSETLETKIGALKRENEMLERRFHLLMSMQPK